MGLSCVREKNEENKTHFSSHFLTLVFPESLEERGEREEKTDLRRAWRSEEGGTKSSEGGGACPYFSVIAFCIFSPPSPTLSHSFFLLI